MLSEPGLDLDFLFGQTKRGGAGLVLGWDVPPFGDGIACCCCVSAWRMRFRTKQKKKKSLNFKIGSDLTLCGPFFLPLYTARKIVTHASTSQVTKLRRLSSRTRVMRNKRERTTPKALQAAASTELKKKMKNNNTTLYASLLSFQLSTGVNVPTKFKVSSP